MAPLFERLKSPDAGERDAAVREFMALREAVAAALQRVAADADDGKATAAGKDLALSLMGLLRLAQCGETVQAQADRGWKKGEYAIETSVYLLWSRSVRADMASVELPQRVSLNGGGAAADLSAYPRLAGALSAIGSSDVTPYKANDEAVAVMHWHKEVVRGGFESILASPAYSGDVKVSAAWLLGEYRMGTHGLLRSMDIRDDKGLTRSYPGRLAVEGVDDEYPAAVALMKGGPVSVEAIIEGIESPSISQSGRERIVRLLMLADPEGTKRKLAQRIDAMPSEESKAALRRLQAIIQ